MDLYSHLTEHKVHLPPLVYTSSGEQGTKKDGKGNDFIGGR
jgi:hypothetical protein